MSFFNCPTPPDEPDPRVMIVTRAGLASFPTSLEADETNVGLPWGDVY